MIRYSPGHWGLSVALTCRGSVLPKSCVVALPCGGVTIVLHYFIRMHWWQSYRLPEPDRYAVAMEPNHFGVQIISGILFVLGFLIVFRANQAYSRWWQGADLLLKVRGDWFNAFSNAMAMCSDAPDKGADVIHFRAQLLRLISLLYGSALAQIRTGRESSMEIIGLEDFDQEHLQHLQIVHDKPEVVMQWVQKLVGSAYNDKLMEGTAPVFARIYNQLGSGMTSYCTARKIAEFPIPFPVAQLISILLVFFWFSTALFCAHTVSTDWWAGLIAFLVIAAFYGINFLAAELEMPFGDDQNDLPLTDMQRDMNASLLSLVHPRVLQVPQWRKQTLNDRMESTLLKVQRSDNSGSAEEQRLAWHNTRQHWLLKVNKHLLTCDELGEMHWEAMEEGPETVELHGHIPVDFSVGRHQCGRHTVWRRRASSHRIAVAKDLETLTGFVGAARHAVGKGFEKLESIAETNHNSHENSISVVPSPDRADEIPKDRYSPGQRNASAPGHQEEKSAGAPSKCEDQRIAIAHL